MLIKIWNKILLFEIKETIWSSSANHFKNLYMRSLCWFIQCRDFRHLEFFFIFHSSKFLMSLGKFIIKTCSLNLLVEFNYLLLRTPRISYSNSRSICVLLRCLIAPSILSFLFFVFLRHNLIFLIMYIA